MRSSRRRRCSTRAGSSAAASSSISDGNDTGSDASLQDTLRRINQTDAFVYAIALDDPGGAAINRRFSPEALNDIAGQTGGYTEVIHDPSDLTAAAERIANELNHQYTIAYAPPRPPDGQYHGIRVQDQRSETDGPVATRIHAPQGEAGRSGEVAARRPAARARRGQPATSSTCGPSTCPLSSAAGPSSCGTCSNRCSRSARLTRSFRSR